MPSVSVRSYSDPEALEAAYVAAAAEITPTGKGPMQAQVARFELERMWVQRVDELSPRVKWAIQSPQRTFIRFLKRPQTDFVIDGAVLQPDELVCLGPGHSYYDRSDGPIHWGGVSLPTEDLLELTRAFTGRDPVAPLGSVHITPPRNALGRLRRLHADLAAPALALPQNVLTTETARSLEQTLAEATMDCLYDQDAREPGWARQCHAMVMRRFRRLLEVTPDQPLYLPEICIAIGVPERTLRLCCQEHLGMSPKHYLLLRRLSLANRALRAADPRETTVAEIATRFGFWHFSRFASYHRTIFGEAPSATLALPPE